MKYTSIALNLFGWLVILVLVACQLANKEKNKREWSLFLFLLLAHSALLLSDSAAWIFEGMVEPIYQVITRVSNFLTYILSAVELFLLMIYIITTVNVDKNIMKKHIALYLTLSMVSVLMVIISQFNGMVYYIDNNNIYYIGDYYWLLMILIMILFASVAVVPIFYAKDAGLRSKATMTIYLVFLIIAMIGDFINGEINTVYSAMTVDLLLIYVNIQIHNEKMLRQRELEMMDRRVALMLSQMKPRLLHDSLLSISELCGDDPLIKKSLIVFSNYLYVNMDSISSKENIPFASELEHTRQYLWLEKLRFEERLTIIYEIETLNFMVPALSLQPIVENAVQHGILLKDKGGTIHIKTEETKRAFRIVITDDGVGFDKGAIGRDGRNHIGIANVSARLKAMCGGSISIESIKGEGSTAVIEIPK